MKNKKIKVVGLPQLMARVGTLLSEGYTFAECIEMLLPYHVKQYGKWQQSFQQAFLDGVGPTQIFQLLGVEKQYLVGIELAEKTGTISDTLAVLAQQMQFNRKMKERFAKLLIYPTFLFVFLVGLFIAFRLYFLPNIEKMVFSRTTSEEVSSIQWSRFFLHVPDYIIIGSLLILCVVVGFLVYLSRKRVEFQLSLLLKIPVLNYFWRLLLTRQFSRALGNLLMTGFSLQLALEQLMKQQHQKQLAYIATEVQARIIYGESLADAVKITSYFFPKFEQFIAHGEHSGLLERELILYSELLDEKLRNFINSATKILQPVLFIVIAICVIAAYLSILLPMYNLLDMI
ncbi:competence type IV pilus assembly protein ComGB [Lysinibacillus sp. 54212]|uniref:competence type IV pilus assembly protein ComGB n=1 Tax=Lysinibacillus sp. 54212 TaxID=3119829 RepID=UPI002FCB161F